MLRIVFLILLLLGVCVSLAGILFVPLLGSGSWGDIGMWGGLYPTAEDDVFIPNGYTITAEYGSVCRNLTVEGMLQSRWGDPSLMNVYGDLTIGYTGHTQPQLGGSIIYNLHGDLEVNGYYMVDYTYFWGDGSENLYVTLSQGPGATIFSNLTQSEPTIELKLLTDLNLAVSGTRSDFYNGEFDLNGHELSNANLHYGYVKSNNYDWTCGIEDCQLSSTHLLGWVYTSGMVEIMDNNCDAIGTINNLGYLCGGWTLTVTWEVKNLINNGTFFTQLGSSFTAYISDYLTNNGTYQVPTYFNGDGTEDGPQVLANNPGGVMQAPLNSIGTWIYCTTDLDLHGYTWDIGNLIIGANLISNGTLYSGTIHSLYGAVIRMSDCYLNSITVAGDLVTSGAIVISDDNVHFNGNLNITQQLVNQNGSASQLDINGNLQLEEGSTLAVALGSEFHVHLAGNLVSSGYINVSSLSFDSSWIEPQIIQINPTGQAYCNILNPGNPGIHLTTNLNLYGYGLSGGNINVDAGLTIFNADISYCGILGGPIYLSDCVFRNSSIMAQVTILNYGTIADNDVMFNGTLTIPETSAVVSIDSQNINLMAMGNLINAGVIYAGNNATFTACCAKGIVNTGYWYVPTLLFGYMSRTINATNLGPSVQVETGSHIVLEGENHMPGFTMQSSATVGIIPGASLTLNDDEFFSGTMINHGVFRNSRTAFSGANQFLDATLDLGDLYPYVSRLTVEHHYSEAPGLGYGINRWWKLTTAFSDTPPSSTGTIVLSYRDTELNGNTEAGLSVYYSANEGLSWSKLPPDQVIHDLANNTFTLGSADLNGLYTLSSQLYNWDPGSVQISSTPEGFIQLSWQATEGAASYEIYKSDTPAGTFQYYDSSQQNSYTDVLVEAKAYYRVTANTLAP